MRHKWNIDVPLQILRIRSIMKIPPYHAAFFGLVGSLTAQEVAPVESKWDVEIPAPPVVETPARPEAAPINFTVLSSRTWKMDVKEAPPMPGLPPVQGTIDVTVELVARPDLPEPPPMPDLPPPDPKTIARWEKVRETYR